MDERRSFSPEYRLRKRREYLSLYRRPDAVIHTAHLVAYLRANRLAHSRLGLTVPKKAGRTVWRNLLKRRLREIFRVRWADFAPNVDIVVNAKRTAAKAEFVEIRDDFDRIVERWVREKETRR